jgi:hypothetical protein
MTQVIVDAAMASAAADGATVDLDWAAYHDVCALVCAD